MSSIGLLFIAVSDAEDLPADFVPRSLGSFEQVVAAIERCTGRTVTGNQVDLTPRFLLLDLEDRDEPRVVTATGVWGDDEREVIRCLCNSLGARFYDSEEEEFIE